MKRVSILLICILYYVALWAQEPEYGLYIQTYPERSTYFTTLMLENDVPVHLDGKNLTMECMLWSRTDNLIGSVFRLQTDNNQTIDMIYSARKDKIGFFPSLVVNRKAYDCYADIVPEQWVKVSVSLNTTTGIVRLSFGSDSVQALCPNIKDTKSVQITFGSIPTKDSSLPEVASVNVKDIRLSLDDRQIRFWQMSQHNDSVCYDSNQYAPATVKNGRWLIDAHVNWNLIFQHQFSNTPSISFAPDKAILYAACDDNYLLTYNVETARLDSLAVKSGYYAASYPNQLLYIQQRNELLSFNLDDNIYAVYDAESSTWKNNRKPIKEHAYWNNTVNYNTDNQSLVSFGGYGFFHYNNDLIISYPFADKTPEIFKIESIEPRRSASSVIVDNTLYLFGGRGSATGRQELAPHDYYDFYSINLTTRQVTKLWEVNPPIDHGDFQPAENMVYDARLRCFYVFCTQRNGTLLRMQADKPGWEVASKPIGNIRFGQSQYVYSNIWFAPTYQKIYAAVLLSDVQNRSNLSVYEINYPFIPLADTEQKVPPTGSSASTRTILIVIIAVSLLALAGLLFYFRSKRQSLTLPAAKSVEAPDETSATDLKHPSITESVTNGHIAKHYDFKRSCVRFLGGFAMIDKDGKDITDTVSPKIRLLLVFLILGTVKYPKGLPIHKVEKILWPDKSELSARNNRNVNLTRMRTVFKKIGDIDIRKDGGYWRILFGENVFCDYVEAMRLLCAIEPLTDEDMERLSELLLQGMMLPNMEYDFIDSYKNEFSELAINVLSALLHKTQVSVYLRLRIADVIFQHDYLNEEAIYAKIRILVRLGKKGFAKQIFEHYCQDYLEAMGTPFPQSFQDLIR